VSPAVATPLRAIMTQFQVGVVVVDTTSHAGPSGAQRRRKISKLTRDTSVGNSTLGRPTSLLSSANTGPLVSAVVGQLSIDDVRTLLDPRNSTQIHFHDIRETVQRLLCM